jgi:hypothetical protein
MLSPVGFGQARLTLPGLMPDARGVVVGRELVARFPTLDRLVWFLRLLSGEQGPDELWLGMRILHGRSALGLREAIALLPNPPGQAGDLVARAARSAGGQCFTGTGRHYVQYRDVHAPFGYDTAEVSHEGADLTLYATDSTAAYRIVGEVPLERLLFGLEPRRHPGSLESLVPVGEGTVVYLSVRRGLGGRIIEHLVRAGVRAEASLCEPERPSAFGVASTYWLIRIAALPARLVSLVARTPGVVPFTPVLDNVLVATGYSHPIHLEACRAVLAGPRLLMFGPPPGGVTALPAPPAFAPIADLVPLRAPPVLDAAPALVRSSAPGPFEVPLRLEPAPGLAARPVAAWVPWAQAAWLRRLCYALPPTALRGHRVALLEPALLVLGSGAGADLGGLPFGQLGGLPFGQLLDEAGPGILVPLGMRITPLVSPRQLAERLGVTEGTFLVFPSAQGPPMRVLSGQIEPLERHILAQARVEPERAPSARRMIAPAPEPAPPDVTHDTLGPWPLWGLRK